MSRDLLRAASEQTALPTYAHPPLVQVRLAIRVAEPLPVARESLTAQLGPVWIPSAPTLSRPSADQTEPRESNAFHLFRSVLGDQRLDIQPSGIDFLWDGRAGDPYPHYESLRDTFLTAYDAWTRSTGDSPSVPVRWQISYRNRFPRGTVWHQLDDLRFCTLLSAAGKTPLAGRLQGFDQTWCYQLDHPSAKLRCDVWFELAGKGSGDEDAIWMQLACDSECRSGVEWLAELDAGRRQIVATFRELMSPEANAYWGVLRG